MKRQKTVFGSIDQVCHVWAQQSQPTGKAGNVFFEDERIYSYGTHYVAGMFHEIKGKTVVLINSDGYSSSTSKHLYSIYSAVRGQIVYSVPNVENIFDPENASYMIGQVTDYIQELFSSSKVTSILQVANQMLSLEDKEIRANEFLSLVGQPLIVLDQVLLDSIKTHLTNRYNRYVELNSPELLALRNDKASKRRLEKLQAETIARKKQEEDREELRLQLLDARADYMMTNNEDDFYELCQLERKVPNDLSDVFIIRNNTLITSRGAEVPLSHAVRLFNRMIEGQLKVGDKVGHFTVDGIDDQDGLVKIGCHTFDIKEVEQLFSNVKSNNGLKLVNQ